MNRERVTLSEIAEACGVSMMSVSRALNNRKGIGQELRTRVLTQAEEMGWRPDPALSALVRYRNSQNPTRKRGEVLAFLAPRDYHERWVNPRGVFHELYQGVCVGADQLGYRLQLVDVDRGGGDLAQHLRTLYNRGICGLLMTSSLDLQEVETKLQESFSVVMLGSGAWRYPFHAVRNDFFQMTQLAVSELKSLGYRRIGYISTGTDRRSNLRPVGALLADAEEHPELKVSVVRESDWRDQNSNVFSEWFSSFRPDVLMSIANPMDHWRLGKDKKVPEDVGIVQINRPAALTSVAGVVSDLHNQGRLAVQRLHQLLTGNETGIPEQRTILRVDGIWCPGETVRSCESP